MSRSPLAYPLNRAADMDVGGAADLQTDVMRFMAILALCLVAIFALVQSIPLAPTEPAQTPVGEQTPVGGPSGPKTASAEVAPAQPEAAPAAPDVASDIPVPSGEAISEPAAAPPQAEEQSVVLTRPKWVPKYGSAAQESIAAEAAPPPVPIAAEAAPAPVPVETPVAEPVEEEGFTLRFASDAALMRSVAAHHVGVYAIDAGRARRMTVSESRISFWDASTPNTFHEMQADTVPVPVVDALARAGAATGSVQWAVTLPGRMTTQLEALMREHRGGDLVIGAGGNITWEASR